MSIYDSKTWRNDLELAVRSISDLEKLEGKTVLLTGATGLIGSAVADILFCYNEKHKKHIHVICAGRSEEKARERFSKYSNEEYYSFVYFDSTQKGNILENRVDYIIHCAGNAYPNAIMKEPVETMESCFLGLLDLLQLADRCNTDKVLFVSSSEVYGQISGVNPIREEEYGFIDPLLLRNAYSMGKRAAETLCISFSTEYDIKVSIVRPGHVYGPTASTKDNRVSSEFAFLAARGEELVLKSDGRQIRSYCYCLDCAIAMIVVLLKGENRRAYNISNPKSILSIRDMTEILADAGGVPIRTEIPTVQEGAGFNPMVNSSLDSAAITSLGWSGIFDADTGFSHTVEIIREISQLKEKKESQTENR